MEGSSQQEKEVMGMDNSVVIGGEGIRGIHGHGKDTIKIN